MIYNPIFPSLNGETTEVTILTTEWTTDAETETITAEISISGVTDLSTIIVSPNPVDSNYKEYNSCGVRCSEQGSGTLKFSADKVPNTDLSVNVIILFNIDARNSFTE